MYLITFLGLNKLYFFTDGPYYPWDSKFSKRRLLFLLTLWDNAETWLTVNICGTNGWCRFCITHYYPPPPVKSVQLDLPVVWPSVSDGPKASPGLCSFLTLQSIQAAVVFMKSSPTRHSSALPSYSFLQVVLAVSLPSVSGFESTGYRETLIPCKDHLHTQDAPYFKLIWCDWYEIGRGEWKLC